MAYDVAQYCLNGHLINSMAASHPGDNQQFCSTCGARTISCCASCNTVFRGMSRGRIAWSPDRPAYCSGCGTALPWTESAIHAAAELAKAAELTEMDQTELPAIIENLVKDVPQTPVAAARLRRLMDKASPYVREGFHKILVDVITEGAKKMIWP